VTEDHGELTGLVAGARRVVAGAADAHLLGFDARTGSQTLAVRVAHADPSPKALSGRRLLFTTSGVVGAVDLVTGRVAWEHRLGFRAGATVSSGSTALQHTTAATVSPPFAWAPARS
jgi:glucose dehydrogenase